MKQVFSLNSADQTAQFASAFASHLSAGATILLNGPVGAGKTHFARQLILNCLAEIGFIEDVPSPTFTLVQTYDIGTTEIWHADLYRLTGPSEVYELGLETAFETSICLVEWPDKLGELAPKNALSITFDLGEDDARIATLEWTADYWTPIVQTVKEGLVNAQT